MSYGMFDGLDAHSILSSLLPLPAVSPAASSGTMYIRSRESSPRKLNLPAMISSHDHEEDIDEF